MSELIEKQKVLDVLREIATEKFSLDDPYGVYINVLIDVEEKICSLPVVQPNGSDNLVKDSQGLAKDLVNDTISRQAAIERATKDHDFYKGATTPADMARRDELLNVMCWLGELPSAQPEQRWIPCSEREPEHAGAYLVTTRVAVEKYVISSWYSPKGGWMCEDHPEAWMPLPEPYKEDDHDNT